MKSLQGNGSIRESLSDFSLIIAISDSDASFLIGAVVFSFIDTVILSHSFELNVSNPWDRG